MKKYLQYRYYVFVAVLFHVAGFIGIAVLRRPGVAAATPYHLLLMFGLLLLSFPRKEKKAWWWIALAFIVGFAAEWIGVHTGLLFGHYRYNTILGYRWQGIPLLIGCNWVMVLSGAYSLAAVLTDNRTIAVLLAAALATAYDWILEPVAVRFGYWHWQGGIQPYNYVCWFGMSLLLAVLWYRWKIRPNQFALTLLLVQALFFMLLRLTL